MKNKITDLRNHLFATLEALQDPDNPMDIDRARAVADVGQVIVNSVKVEVDFIRAISDAPLNVATTGFIAAPESEPLGEFRQRLIGSGK